MIAILFSQKFINFQVKKLKKKINILYLFNCF